MDARQADEEVGVGAHQIGRQIMKAGVGVAIPHGHLLGPGVFDGFVDIGVEGGRDGGARDDQVARQDAIDAWLDCACENAGHRFQIFVAPTVAKGRFQPWAGTQRLEDAAADLVFAARHRPEAHLVYIAAIIGPGAFCATDL